MKLAEDLKKAILKIAMQGKLTEQKETDSNIDDLLGKISEGKQRLISQGLITKEKVVSEISEDELPFDIPNSWRWIKVGEVLGIARGGSPRPINSYLTNSEDGFNWIKIGDTEIGGKYINHTAQKIKKEGLHKTRLVHKGDLLLSNSMSFGRPYILNIDGCIHDGWLVLHDYTGNLNKEFLFYLFSSPILKEQFSGKVSGAVVKNLNSDKVAETIIPLPPIEEQQRIVEKLNTIVPLLEDYGKAENELIDLFRKFPKEMRTSVIQTAMQGKLSSQSDEDTDVEETLKYIADEKQNLISEGKIEEKKLSNITEDEIPFDIPNNWRWKRWGDLSYSIQYGYNASGQEKGKIKMVRISDIHGNKVSWDTVPYCEIKDAEISTYLLKENDILFARTGGTVGKSFLVKNVPYNAIYAGYLIRTQYNSEKLVPEFLKYFMESELYWNQLRNGTKATAQPNCNGKTLSKMIVPLPPIEEQQRIVDKLNSILPLIEDIEVNWAEKKIGRPKQEEALAFINSLLETKKTTRAKPVTPGIIELTVNAKKQLPAVVEKYAKLMGVTYNRITIRHQKTRWGSCTKTGNLSFNCLLMKMPENVRDYVIVHELAHRKELNHSNRFWALVEEFCPWYKESKKWLKDNEKQLTML